MLRRLQPGRRQPRALAQRHLRQVRLDILDAVAITPGEIPAARRQPGGDFDHLLHRAAAYRLIEQCIDGAMARQQEAFQRRPAQTAPAEVERPQRVIQRTPFRRHQPGMRQTMAIPDIAGVVRGGTDRIGTARRQRDFQGSESPVLLNVAASSSKPRPGT